MAGSWWSKPPCSMWRPTVVVSAVPGKGGPQVPFAEDQDAVGEFSQDGQDESFGEAVRSRTSGRDLYGVDPRTGHDRIERTRPPGTLRRKIRKSSAATGAATVPLAGRIMPTLIAESGAAYRLEVPSRDALVPEDEPDGEHDEYDERGERHHDAGDDKRHLHPELNSHRHLSFAGDAVVGEPRREGGRASPEYATVNASVSFRNCPGGGRASWNPSNPI